MIRDILYLDTERLYSLSSQLFEGVTESVVRRAREASDSQTQQEGPHDSGRLLADIMSSERVTEWRGVLHDHALTLFESELRQRGALLELSPAAEIQDVEACIASRDLVLVDGSSRLHDYIELDELVKKFNKIASALMYVMGGQDGSSTVELRKRLQKAKPTDRDKVLEGIARESGMAQDPMMLESLRFLIQHGFSGHLELRISWSDGRMFSVPLEERWMRQSRLAFVRRWSRRPHFDVRVLGLIGQAGGDSSASHQQPTTLSNPREGFDSLVVAMEQMEASMMSRYPKEIVIDPIAVYRPLSVARMSSQDSHGR